MTAALLRTPSTATTARLRYVPEVDALRGLAMTLVILFHCRLLPPGWMGVWVFYVVSGFSVATSLFAQAPRQGGAAAAMLAFHRRRARRIWPLYFAFLAGNVVVLTVLRQPERLQGLPWLLSFTSNLWMIVTVDTARTHWAAFGHLWTLAVEQQFYLLLPLLLLLPGRTSRARALLAAIALAPLLRLAVGHAAAAQGWDDGRVSFAIYAFAPAHFDAFAGGALVALFRAEIAARPRRVRVLLLLALALAALHAGVYAGIGVARDGATPDALRNVVSGVPYGQGREVSVYWVPSALALAVLAGFLAGQRHCRRIGGIVWLQAVGRISYGGYLFHIPVLMLLGQVAWFNTPVGSLEGALAHLALFACAYPVTLALAWLSFHHFEARFR